MNGASTSVIEELKCAVLYANEVASPKREYCAIKERIDGTTH